jgi:hypothetical protein
LACSLCAELSLNEKGIEFSCFGKLVTSITYMTGSGKHRRSNTAHGGEEILKVDVPTGTQGKETKFARASITRFPFECQIPANAPATMQARGASWGVRVDYGITALAHVSGLLTSNLSAGVTIIVVDPIAPVYATQPAPKSLWAMKISKALEVPKVMCFSCCGTYHLTLDASIPRTAFSPNDTIPITLDVSSNRPAGIHSLTVTLAHHYQVTAGSRSREFDEHVETVTVVQSDQGKPGKAVFHVQLPARKLLPDFQRKDMLRTSRILVACYATDVYGIDVSEHTSSACNTRKKPTCVMLRECVLLTRTIWFPPRCCLQVPFPLANPVAPGVLPPLPSGASTAASSQQKVSTAPLSPQPASSAEVEMQTR